MGYPSYPPTNKIVTICGSMRFKRDMLKVAAELTLDGWIVLAPFITKEGNLGALSDDEKAALDELHLRKIDMSRLVHVVNTGGYIGESTRREIKYARRRGLPIVFTDQVVEP